MKYIHKEACEKRPDREAGPGETKMKPKVNLLPLLLAMKPKPIPKKKVKK